MSMDETSARRVVLAQAVETADTQGRLLSEVERGLIDQQARHAARASGAGPVPPERFLDLRAQRLLQVVGERNRAIGLLQAGSPWHTWLMAAAPVGTLLLGALTERIADPHRVDLLSLPLIGIVLWNVVVYVLLVAGRLVPPRPDAHPVLDALRRWSDGWREWRGRLGQLRADVTMQFHLHWNAATSALQMQRWKAVLHLAALGWATGVAASLLVQGLVVQYRVGWESTFLNARQVHDILSVLLAPVVWLFPFDAFSIQEVARLQLGPGDIAQADSRWVWMYAALLLVVVIVPRALLAGIAIWRAKALSRRVRLDLRSPYFQRIVSLLSPARVQLCLVTHRSGDRAALMRVLVQEGDVARELISSPAGDALLFAELSGTQPPPPAAQARHLEQGWAGRFMNALSRIGSAAATPAPGSAHPLDAMREEVDVVLHVVGAATDLEAAQTLLAWIGKPVVVLVNPQAGPGMDEPGLMARLQARARDIPLIDQVLAFGTFAGCWVQEGVLLEAIRHCLPEAKVPGFERIAAAWHARNRQRFERSMMAVAEHLLYAARQVEEVPSGTLSVKSLVVATQREAQAQARQAAMAAVATRLGASAAGMFATLRSLHGLDQSAADALEGHLEEKFVVHQAIDMPQAGMTGAATGAAMGASVDLLAGGLTLGAAAALGALVGAGAATIGAAWKNRSTPSGATVVQLSDQMMQALVEAALLRYLAVAHDGRAPAGGLSPFWKADVVAAVEAHNVWLAPFWAAARAQPETVQASALSLEVETVASKVLDTLYPPPRPSR